MYAREALAGVWGDTSVSIRPSMKKAQNVFIFRILKKYIANQIFLYLEIKGDGFLLIASISKKRLSVFIA